MLNLKYTLGKTLLANLGVWFFGLNTAPDLCLQSWGPRPSDRGPHPNDRGWNPKIVVLIFFLKQIFDMHFWPTHTFIYYYTYVHLCCDRSFDIFLNTCCARPFDISLDLFMILQNKQMWNKSGEVCQCGLRDVNVGDCMLFLCFCWVFCKLVLPMGFLDLVLRQVTDHVLKDEIAMETWGAQSMWWNNHVT